MEFEDNDEPVLNSSTEFLITENKKPGLSDQHCEGSSAVTGDEVTGEQTVFATGRSVTAADSADIICEFTDSVTDTGPFLSRNIGAGELANSEDVWLSQPAVHPDIHKSLVTTELTVGDGNSEFGVDRKADYVQYSFSDRTVDDNVAEITDTPALQLVDSSCKSPSDGGQNQAVQLSSTVPLASQQLADENDHMTHGSSDMFSDFIASSYGVTEDTNSSHMVGTTVRSLAGGDKNQCMQLSNPFLDSDKLNEQFGDGEPVLVPGPTDVRLPDQPPMESSNEISFQKHTNNTSLPDVHRSAVKQELISESDDQLLSTADSSGVTEGGTVSHTQLTGRPTDWITLAGGDKSLDSEKFGKQSSDDYEHVLVPVPATAQSVDQQLTEFSSKLSQPLVDSADGITFEEIQVNSLYCYLRTFY